MESDVPEAQNSFDQLLFAAQAALNRRLLRKFRQAGLDLTVEQWSLLLRLWRREGVTQHQIALCSGKDAPSVTRLLDNMEKNDWVRREPCLNDRRVKYVYLTEKSRGLQPLLCTLTHEAFTQAFAGVCPEKVAFLQETLRQIIGNLNADCNPCNARDFSVCGYVPSEETGEANN